MLVTPNDIGGMNMRTPLRITMALSLLFAGACGADPTSPAGDQAASAPGDEVQEAALIASLTIGADDQLEFADLDPSAALPTIIVSENHPAGTRSALGTLAELAIDGVTAHDVFFA